MLSEVMDIETMINLFTYTGYCRQTKTYHQFVIHKLRNDYEALIQHLKRDKLIQIGYNNEAFDYPVIHHLINHYDEYKYLNGYELSQKIYEKAQSIINEQFTSVADYNKHIKQIDLFKIHHYDNKAKLTSLKALEISMRLNNVEDMPYPHDYWITTLEEIDEVLAYNKWDVYSTNEFLNITLGQTDHSLYSGKNKIELRQTLGKKYNLPCLNWNDIKIGTELILKLYCNKTKRNPKEIKQLRTYRNKINLKECIPYWVSFKTKEFNNLKNKIQNTVITQTKGGFNESVIFHGMKFDYGTGGIHSSIKPGVYTADEEWCIIDFDVNSLYPSIAIALGLYPEHLGPEFLEVYDHDIVSVRLAEKEKPKNERDNVIVEGYKLAANGTYGKSNSEDSFLYDPLYTMKTTIAGQLFVSMWIERLVLSIPSCTILQSNTDGVTVYLKRDDLETYRNIISQLTVETGLSFEENEYLKMIIIDVNNYIAQYTNGKCKYKGLFEIDKELHKDPSMRIVPIALSNYFIKNIPISQTIKNHSDIYDYCLRLKLNSAFSAEFGYIKYISEYHNITNEDEIKDILLNNGYNQWYNNSWYIDNPQGAQSLIDAWNNFKYTRRIPIKDTLKLGKNTRFYISNQGGALYKIKNDSKKITGVNVGYVTTIFNKYIEKPMNEYNINYQFYINECNKIIYQIEDKQLSLF